jgi:hypothetical protein
VAITITAITIAAITIAAITIADMMSAMSQVTNSAEVHGRIIALVLRQLQQLCPLQAEGMIRDLLSRGGSQYAAWYLAAVLRERASDVSSLDEQRAEMQMREDAVVKERAAVQQLMVGIADMAKRSSAVRR